MAGIAGLTRGDVAGEPKLHVTVTDDDGNVVYRTWNAAADYKTVTLYLDETDELPDDARREVAGPVIGRSVWGLDPIAERRRADELASRG